MKKIYIVGLILLILPILFFGYLGFQSQQGKAAGLVDGKLQACPNTPNCVCSETKIPDEHFIEPLNTAGLSSQEALSKVKSIISKMGAEVTTQEEDYLAATFTSDLFKYVDDIEMRFDKENNLLHFRSASRVGKSDFGVNRERVEAIRTEF